MTLNKMTKALFGGLTVAMLVVAPASAALIDFDQISDTGTLSGDFGVGGIVLGAGIEYGFALGVDTPQNDGAQVFCEVGCVLDFATGASLGEVAPGTNIYTFAPGGTFTLRGEMAAIGIGDGNPGTPDSELILQGYFGTSTLIITGNNYTFAATGYDNKNDKLVDFYFGAGYSASMPDFLFSNTEISALGERNGTVFRARVTEGDLTNTLPEPSSILLTLVGLAGIVGSRFRRRI